MKNGKSNFEFSYMYIKYGQFLSVAGTFRPAQILKLGGVPSFGHTSCVPSLFSTDSKPAAARKTVIKDYLAGEAYILSV